MQIRLDKFVSENGGYSRQEAKKLISQGCVAVSGQVIKKSDFKLETTSQVKVNGNIIEYSQFVYIMLNKPKGVVSAAQDKNDVTVVDLVKDNYPKRELFPAGRLDKNSTGFVLLTDDGKFAHDILAPKKHISKTYIVTLDSPLTADIIKEFNEGVTLKDGTILKSAYVEPYKGNNIVKVVLKQGVYHQIKRMFGVFGIGVDELCRTHIGGVRLDDNLKSGESRDLTLDEIQQIFDENIKNNINLHNVKTIVTQ